MLGQQQFCMQMYIASQ